MISWREADDSLRAVFTWLLELKREALVRYFIDVMLRLGLLADLLAANLNWER